MSVEKMTSAEICKLLEIIVGNTEPVADTAIDEKCEQNLKTLIDIGNWVLDGLLYAAEHRHDPYYSSRSIGERAYATMCEWKDWLSAQESGTAVPIHPYGRLIDADAFAAKIIEIIERQGYDDFYTQSLSVGEILREVVHDLKGEGFDGFSIAPTIIETEVKENA